MGVGQGVEVGVAGQAGEGELTARTFGRMLPSVAPLATHPLNYDGARPMGSHVRTHKGETMPMPTPTPETRTIRACSRHVVDLAGMSDRSPAYRGEFMDDAYMGMGVGECDACPYDALYVWTEKGQGGQG